MKMKSYSALGAMLLQAIGLRSQREVAEWCGVNQATVSYWINGERRPRPSHLVDLASLLKLDLEELAQAAGYEPEEIIKLQAHRSISIHDLDFFEKTADIIYKLRIQGNPQLTVEMADNFLGWLQAKQREILPSNFPPQLKKIHGRVLAEKATAIGEVISTEKVLAATQPLCYSLQTLADQYEDNEPFASSYLALADSYYVQRKYKDAIWHAKLGLAIVNNLDDQLLLYRTTVMSLAYLGDEDALQRVSKKVSRLIETGQFIHLECACTAYEGVGRAQGLLKQPQAVDTLVKASNIYEQILAGNEKAPFRFIQIVRSMLETMKALQTYDAHFFENLGYEALHLAHIHYPRYALQLTNLVDK